MNLFSFIFGSIAFLIQLYSDKYRQDDLDITLDELENDDNLPRIKVYDFIVVGGGGAGCVIAHRLSKYFNVLLLEAGGTPVPATNVPIFKREIAFNPSINYKFTSVPQLYGAFQSNGIINITTGKMLGGSTSHYDMIYSRGNPLDFDNWAQLTNDDSWKYENILKYFKKSENFIGEGVRSQHGYKGLMTIDTSTIPIFSTFLEAGAELEYETTLDPNGPQKESFSATAVYRKYGHRVSTYTAFIKPFEKFNKKLHIQRYSQVLKILINVNKRAYGVAYTRHNIPQIAHASKEVIISCGSIGSPMLLMKSGIGPSNILKEAGIPMVADLLVGKVLRTHMGVSIEPFTVNDFTLFPSLEKELNENVLIEYHKNGRGALGKGLVGASAIVTSSRAKHDGDLYWPDLNLFFHDRFTSSVITKIPSISFFVSLGRGKSYGNLNINSTHYKTGIRNDEELAVIDYNILSNSGDVDVIVEGIKLTFAVMENTTAFQKLGTKFIGMKHDGCIKYQFRSDEYWRCYVRQTITPLVHLTSTCRMGFGSNDKNAVLDSKLNVLGVSNLKVVDASIMPVDTNTFPAAPTIMIAEKISSEILKYWIKYIA